MLRLLAELPKQYPNLKFTASDHFYWSPKSNEVFYDASAESETAAWSLLHESGHALLEHKHYTSDYDLILIEVAAWEKAKALASDFAVTIDPEHIQDCLDTYRDWIDRRSTCPTCNTKTLQQSKTGNYRCFNCYTSWKVNSDRFRRCYRKIAK